METDSYKLIGAPVGHHGPYAFYKALRISRPAKEQIIAIGDFFFVRLWQDSELMAIGELQLLWTDRGAGRTLASLRLYFLPENTPAGRAHHGEDEVVGISERVVVRAEELLAWVCGGSGWRWGLRAAWAPPAPNSAPNSAPNAAPVSAPVSAPISAPVAGDAGPPPVSASARLDMTDVDREKRLIADDSEPAVAVFSYPRYCRYRAMLRRLEGAEPHWLHHPLVVALGGYLPPTSDTKILYCRETFEYPELEGHEFVCNHMAPRLKGRAGRGRRRKARSASRSSNSDSGSSPPPQPPAQPSRALPSLGASRAEERAFMQRLRLFHRATGPAPPKGPTLGVKELNLHQLYAAVVRGGGYESVTRGRGWRRLLASMGAPSTGSQATLARRHYERLLLPFEKSERRSNQGTPNGTPVTSSSTTPTKPDRKKHLANILNNSVPIATIDISDSPVREVSSPAGGAPVPRLRTPPPTKRKDSGKKAILQNGDKSDDCKGSIINLTDDRRDAKDEEDECPPENNFDPSNILNLNIGRVETDCKEEYIKVKAAAAAELNQEFLDSLPAAPPQEPPRIGITLVPPEKLLQDHSLATDKLAVPTRARPSSLRSVRVKPERRLGPAGTSPPAPPPPPSGPPSDDDLIEVPYRPKSPEIIDLDLYESPESPQSAKRKKLDILKRGGLEVTPVRGWPGLDPVFQQQILNQAHFLQTYGSFPAGHADGLQPPRVTQGKSIYGSSSPEKTVYGNPKDLFMPPPHVLQGVAPRKVTCLQKPSMGPDILDLTVRPAVEIMRVSNNTVSDQPQNLSSKKVCNNTVQNSEPRQINSALEITLVAAKNRAPRAPQKRSSSGKFMSNKGNSSGSLIPYTSPTSLPVPPLIPRSHSKNNSSSNHTNSSSSLVIPNYQVSSTSNIGSVSPVSSGSTVGTSVASNLLQGAGGTLLQNPKSGVNTTPPPFVPLLDTSLYMNALYSSLAGPMAPSLTDHQLAIYNELVSRRLLGRYPVPATATHTTPTSKS